MKRKYEDSIWSHLPPDIECFFCGSPMCDHVSRKLDPVTFKVRCRARVAVRRKDGEWVYGNEEKNP